jgi:hypothetical protein
MFDDAAKGIIFVVNSVEKNNNIYKKYLENLWEGYKKNKQITPELVRTEEFIEVLKENLMTLRKATRPMSEFKSDIINELN